MKSQQHTVLRYQEPAWNGHGFTPASRKPVQVELVLLGEGEAHELASGSRLTGIAEPTVWAVSDGGYVAFSVTKHDVRAGCRAWHEIPTVLIQAAKEMLAPTTPSDDPHDIL